MGNMNKGNIQDEKKGTGGTFTPLKVKKDR
jgi:hypothetical protein